MTKEEFIELIKKAIGAQPPTILPSLIIKDLPDEIREQLMRKYCNQQGVFLDDRDG